MWMTRETPGRQFSDAPVHAQLVIPSGGTLTATLCGRNGESLEVLGTSVESDMFYSINCTSDPAPLINFVKSLPDTDNAKSTMQSIMDLPPDNPRIVPLSLLYGLLRDDEGRYHLKDNHVRAIIVQSRAVSQGGSIYDSKCPCCKVQAPGPTFVYMRFQHCAGVPRCAHTGCASCVWQVRDCHATGDLGNGSQTKGKKRKRTTRSAEHIPQ